MMARPWRLLLPALGFYLALFVAGHVGVIAASLHDAHGLTLALFRQFFASDYNLATLLRTLRLSTLTTLATLLVGYPIAAYLAHPDSRARLPVIFAVVAPMLMSAVARSYGWIILLGPGGVLQHLGLAPLLYTEAGLVIALSHVFLPFMVLAIVGSLQQIDPALHRAAEILGLQPDWILCGNGSDDILTIVTRTFVGQGQLLRLPAIPPACARASRVLLSSGGRAHL